MAPASSTPLSYCCGFSTGGCCWPWEELVFDLDLLLDLLPCALSRSVPPTPYRPPDFPVMNLSPSLLPSASRMGPGGSPVAGDAGTVAESVVTAAAAPIGLDKLAPRSSAAKA